MFSPLSHYVGVKAPNVRKKLFIHFCSFCATMQKHDLLQITKLLQIRVVEREKGKGERENTEKHL